MAWKFEKSITIIIIVIALFSFHLGCIQPATLSIRSIDKPQVGKYFDIELSRSDNKNIDSVNVSPTNIIRISEPVGLGTPTVKIKALITTAGNQQITIIAKTGAEELIGTKTLEAVLPNVKITIQGNNTIKSGSYGIIPLEIENSGKYNFTVRLELNELIKSGETKVEITTVEGMLKKDNIYEKELDSSMKTITPNITFYAETNLKSATTEGNVRFYFSGDDGSYYPLFTQKVEITIYQ
jgi:hypothetical protein